MLLCEASFSDIFLVNIEISLVIPSRILTHFMPLVSFYPPWKNQKRKSFKFPDVFSWTRKRPVAWNGLTECDNLRLAAHISLHSIRNTRIYMVQQSSICLNILRNSAFADFEHVIFFSVVKYGMVLVFIILVQSPGYNADIFLFTTYTDNRYHVSAEKYDLFHVSSVSHILLFLVDL